MQLSYVLSLASAATVLAKVYNDNSPIPASVPNPSNAVTMHADTFGTAVEAVSARLHAKDLAQAQAFSIVVCEHSNFGGSCWTITGIDSGVCCKFIGPKISKLSPNCIPFVAVSNKKTTDNINGIWNDVISSTDTQGHTCTVFEHQGCGGDQSTVNGRVNWGHMNDKISAFRCFQ